MSKIMSVSHNKEIDLATGEMSDSIYVRVYRTMFTSGLVAKIGATNFTTLLALSIYMNEKGECFPTQQTVADIIGVHKNTVNKYINQLLEVEFDGQPLVTRKKVNKGMGQIQSYYTIHPISQVAIFNGQVKELSTNLEKTVTPSSDESIPTDCAVTITNKQDNNYINNSDQVKSLNSSSGIKYFQEIYSEVYGVNYVVSNYGREGKLMKDKVITPYPDLAREIIEYAVREYAAKFKNAKYPRPTIAMFSWATNQIVGHLEEVKSVNDAAADFEARESEAEKLMMLKLAKLGEFANGN